MSNKKINIIYLIPSYKKPSGGSMVAYNHSRIINSFKKINISSQILHYKKKRTAKLITSLKKIFKIRNYKNEFGYKPNEIKVVKNFHPLNNWVNYNLAIKNDLKFDKQSDFIILPEIIAHFADEFFIKNKIKYAIFLQGIYHMHQTSNIKLLKKSYANAEFVLTIGEDTKKNFEYIFPQFKKKILKINFSIKNNFLIKKKENIISCMPRKLPEDFHLLNLFNLNKIKKKWKFVVLNNLSEENLKKKLSKSRIFLSFSNFEGTGIPPLEAALAGNKVIGYTGNGGNSYFKKPIFNKINKGDIFNFSNILINNIKNLPKRWHLSKKVKLQRGRIAKKYSEQQEIILLKKMINKINKIMK
jgi:hypothetical protein